MGENGRQVHELIPEGLAVRTGIGRASILISALSAVNMAIGLVNQVIIANYFGTSADLDSFLVASALPSVFSGIALSVFSSTLIPLLTPIKSDRNELSKAVSTVTFISLILIILIVVGGLALKELILKLSTNLKENELALASRLAGYIWMITGFVVLNALCASLFNLFKNFIAAASVGLLPTLGMIVGTIGFGKAMGIEGLVVGWLSMAALSSILLIPVLVKCGLSWREIRLGGPYARQLAKAIVPVSVGLLPFTVLPTFDAFWASQLGEGSMSYIGYCTRIVVGLGAFVVSGVYVVILPYLSENVVENHYEVFTRRLELSIKYVLLATIPLVTFFAFFGQDIVSVLFKRGRFDQHSTLAVASLLPFYLVGLLAMAPATILSRGYFALKRYKQFGLLSLAAIVLYFGISGILSKHYSLYGIGVSYSMYWLLFFAAGVLLLDSTIISRETLVSVTKCAGCSLSSCTVVYLGISSNVQIPSSLALAIYGGLAAFLFLVLSYYLNIIKLTDLGMGLLRQVGRQ